MRRRSSSTSVKKETEEHSRAQCTSLDEGLRIVKSLRAYMAGQGVKDTLDPSANDSCGSTPQIHRTLHTVRRCDIDKLTFLQDRRIIARYTVTRLKDITDTML